MSWLDILVMFLGWFSGAYLGGLYFDHRRKKASNGKDAD